MTRKQMACSLTRFVMVLCLLTIFAIPGAIADNTEPIRILITPFQINAQQDLLYLSGQIAEILAQRLSAEGAVAVPKGESDRYSALEGVTEDLEAITNMARQHDAAHVIWGTFTLIGDRFSLDARLLVLAPEPETKRFFAQGQNLENIISVAGDLAEQIALSIFRRQMVATVSVQGNQRIEPDAILRIIDTRQGGIYRADTLSDDLRAIYNMGFFDDVRVEAHPGPDGRDIVFHVKEKPTIRRINIRGNAYIKEEDIRNNLTISTGAILNIFRVYSNIEQIETLYKNKNYHQVDVDYAIRPLDHNQADLDFIIEEGPKIYVTEIAFEGNRSFQDKQLQKVIKVSKKGFFYWLTSSGDLDRSQLDQDVIRLNDYYSNQGFINVRVGEPQVDIEPEGIRVTFRIDEGQRYKVGRVELSGDLIRPAEELFPMLRTPRETYFNREMVRNDVLTLIDLYADQGYAYADIVPRTDQDPEALSVHIDFHIQKRDLVFLERIAITGNTRTRDKVIRRELHVFEQHLFSGSGLKRSLHNLHRLEYFEDIKVDTIQGSTDDRMVLALDVTEKPTGAFSFGAGYSSEEHAFFLGSISQRNLFGRGQILDFSGQIGARTTRFSLNFTEPYLFDTQLSASATAYNQVRDYDRYERSSMGGGLLFGYPVADYTRFFWGYDLDQSTIKIDTGFEDAVSDTIRELRGTNLTSSTNIRLVYDSRDRLFNPSKGSRHSISVEYAGLGGDIGFTKYIGQTTWYKPLVRSLVGSVNARIGIVEKIDDSKLLPDYEKFYLGGINSMRGFGYRGVYLTELNREGNEVKVGGGKMVQFNLELIFPLLADMGVHGVLFYDTGNVYNGSIALGNLRQSAGGGIRWLSPIAPLRLEYGYILDRKEGEPTGNWEFTLGGVF